MAMEVKGTLIQVLKIESGTSKAGKEWQKQDFVIETNEQYPKKVCFTLFGDKVSLINGVKEGDEVEVFFNLESRDFNGKWYHNINAWKIEINKAASGGASSGLRQNETVADMKMPEDEGNDLPF